VRHRPRFLLPLPATLAALALLAAAGVGWHLVRLRIGQGALAGSAHDVIRPHQATPPHGGTLVALGDDAFGLELLRDPATGSLRAYVLDGELESFIRIPARQLDLELARAGRSPAPLRLAAVADPVTGETVGDTSLFQARAPWLRGPGPCTGRIRSITVRGQTFRSMPFALP
jgi:hypothetical protein